MSESPTSSDIGLDTSGSTKAQKSKFTRSRNGCVTCRQRRVKCDEKRPLCGNCAKGNRDCIYPIAPASTTSPVTAPEHAHDYSYFDASLAAQSAAFQTAVSPNAYSTLSTPTSAATVPLRSPNEHSEFFEPLTPGSQAMLSALPKAEQAYLRFFEQHMTFHHFFSKYDFDQFFSIMLPHAALRYPPLHYALLAFVALHHAMTRVDGKIEAFVAFHDQAVSLLRQSLAADEPETPERILTVLQLATYEEYVADWAMLIDHQNAAQNMIQNFYTPNDIMETTIGRWTLLWYLRNELITGFLAGQTTTLNQEWMQTMDVWYKARSAQVPTHLPYRVDSLFASHKVLAVGVSAVMANFIQHGMSQDELLDRAVAEQEKLTTWELQLQPLKDYTQFQVTPLARTFDSSDPLSLNLIRPAIIYSGPLWSLNFLISEHLSLRLVQAMQLSSRVGSMIDPKSIIELALQLSQIIESVHSWPGTPPGALLAMKDSLGLVSVVLPVDQYYIAWISDKFAAVENLGCTTPQHLRDTLAARWGLPHVERWWYENGDKFRPVLSNLRTFMEERKADARTQKAVNVWQLKGIYG